MNWRELLNPDALMARAFKLCVTILVIIMLAALAQKFVASVSSGSMLLFLVCTSIVAHQLRERRLKRRERRGNTRGAERVPVLPQAEDHL